MPFLWWFQVKETTSKDVLNILNSIVHSFKMSPMINILYCNMEDAHYAHNVFLTFKRRRFNVMDAKTMLCAYWVESFKFIFGEKLKVLHYCIKVLLSKLKTHYLGNKKGLKTVVGNIFMITKITHVKSHWSIFLDNLLFWYNKKDKN